MPDKSRWLGGELLVACKPLARRVTVGFVAERRAEDLVVPRAELVRGKLALAGRRAAHLDELAARSRPTEAQPERCRVQVRPRLLGGIGSVGVERVAQNGRAKALCRDTRHDGNVNETSEST